MRKKKAVLLKNVLAHHIYLTEYTSENKYQNAMYNVFHLQN